MIFSQILRQLSPKLRSDCYKSSDTSINISFTYFYEGCIYPGEIAIIAKCDWNNGTAKETFSLFNNSNVVICLQNMHFDGFILVSEIWECD